MSEESDEKPDALAGLEAFLKSKPNIVKSLKNHLDEISGYLEDGFRDYFLSNLDVNLRNEFKRMETELYELRVQVRELTREKAEVKA